MKNSASSFIFGLLAGAAVGVVAGILLAPDKGSVTREKLRKKASEIGEDLRDRFEEMAEGDLGSVLNKKPSAKAKATGKTARKAGGTGKKPGRPSKTRPETIIT